MSSTYELQGGVLADGQIRESRRPAGATFRGALIRYLGTEHIVLIPHSSVHRVLLPTAVHVGGLLGHRCYSSGLPAAGCTMYEALQQLEPRVELATNIPYTYSLQASRGRGASASSSSAIRSASASGCCLSVKEMVQWAAELTAEAFSWRQASASYHC